MPKDMKKLKTFSLSNQEIEHLSKFEYNIDKKTFEKLFIKNGGTKRMSEHLWDKYNKYDHKILTLWSTLDLENQRIMKKVVNDWKR